MFCRTDSGMWYMELRIHWCIDRVVHACCDYWFCLYSGGRLTGSLEGVWVALFLGFLQGIGLIPLMCQLLRLRDCGVLGWVVSTHYCHVISPVPLKGHDRFLVPPNHREQLTDYRIPQARWITFNFAFDVYERPDGSINVTGQKFYRPELMFNENSENLEPIESRRILYYSFDKCEFPADSVMHKCRVHYLEPDKNIPSPKQHPGFIVRKVYDSISNKLNELLDSGFEEWKQREISLLVQRTNQIIN
ncbi:bromo adjacent homology domain-containing protein [Tanacetum coccineum]